MDKQSFQDITKYKSSEAHEDFIAEVLQLP